MSLEEDGVEKKTADAVVAVENGDGLHHATVGETAAETRSAIPIKPVVKDYAWGIRGMDSRVGRYALACGSIAEIDHDCPYAELWIGTHPSGPTVLQDAHDAGGQTGRLPRQYGAIQERRPQDHVSEFHDV